MSRALVALVLITIVAAPPVSASQLAEGFFHTAGVHTFSSAVAGGAARAGFVAFEDLNDVYGRWGYLRVTTFEQRVISPSDPISAADAALPATGASWISTNVSLSMAPTRPSTGFIGIYPDDAILEVNSDRFTDLYPASSTRIGPDEGSDAPDQPWYVATVSGPHIHLQGTGTVTLEGSAAVKILGPTMRFVSDQNETTIHTGYERVSPVEVVTRWVYLEFEEGVFSVEPRIGSFDLAMASVDHLAWDGTVTFQPVSGFLDVDAKRYRADGSTAMIEGKWEGTLRPVSGDKGDFVLHGVLARSTLFEDTEYAATGDARLGRPAGWLSVVAMSALVIAGATVGIKHLLARASEAEEDEDWLAASIWLRRARATEPKDGDAAIREATCLRNLGDVEGALACYEEAAILRVDAEAECWAATLCVRQGRSSEAATYLVRALRKDPSVAREVALDPIFEPLLADQAVAMVVAEAGAD